MPGLYETEAALRIAPGQTLERCKANAGRLNSPLTEQGKVQADAHGAV